MGSIHFLILIEPGQLVLGNNPVVRHEPPIEPLQTRAPVHPHPEGVQFSERIYLLSFPHLLCNVIGVVRPKVVEGILGILLSGSLDGGHLVRVKNHKADLVREDINEKKTFSLGHCPNHLTPPLTPIRATWSLVGRGGRYINNLKNS